MIVDGLRWKRTFDERVSLMEDRDFEIPLCHTPPLRSFLSIPMLFFCVKLFLKSKVLCVCGFAGTPQMVTMKFDKLVLELVNLQPNGVMLFFWDVNSRSSGNKKLLKWSSV